MADRQTIVTRFAPSPTGFLHIGGARTALFNWLYARGARAAEGSRFVLRIEDTDRARHSEEAVTAILAGLEWLGLDWDGDPISQFERSARHAEVAHQLLQSGHAYRCWLAGDALNEARDDARANNRRFTSPWRDHTGPTPEGPFAIRLKAPLEGDTVLSDEVQGIVKFPNQSLDDMVLLRSDGTPTYMLAVVVDDHDMGITHVIRGDDHLINAGRQTQLLNALGWSVPVYAHVPLIHGKDGKKLSKRHGAVGIEEYRDQGFLPEGVRNGLLRLGWSHGDDEIIPTDRALEWFDLSGINKAPARLDPDKIAATNAEYLRQMPDEAFTDAASAFLPTPPTDEERARLVRGAPALKERCQTFCDYRGAAAYLLAKRPLTIEGKKAKPLRQDGARDTIKKVHDLLTTLDVWSIENIDDKLKAYAETTGVPFGKVGPPVRAAVTGGNPSPSLGETLFALGREESLARLSDQC